MSNDRDLYFDDFKPGDRRDVDEVTYWNGWRRRET